MITLFNRISAWLPNPPDWCSEPKAHALAASVLTLRPSTCVEIGVWRGTSLIPVAMALKEIGKGIIIGIDPWQAEASVDGQTGENREWWSKVDHEPIYKGFMAEVNRLGVSDVVKVERKKSDDVEPPSVIDLFHCDGNHGSQAIRDVERFAMKVRIGGLCFMDDIGWAGGTVAAACLRLLEFGFIKIYDLEGGAMFQRIRP